MNRLRTRLRASIASGPLVLLDFLSGGLDPRVTFTRGSNATLVDSTGKITYAPANLVLRSQEIATTPWVGDTIGGSVPTATNNAGTAPDGTETATRLQLNRGAGTLSRWRQPCTGPTGFYLASIWMRTTSGTGTANVGIRNEATGVNCVVTGTWQRFSIINANAVSAPDVQILSFASIPGTDVSADILVWGAQLEQVTYQTTPSTYNATTTAAYYGPRFDYNPTTLAPMGLLIEEQRTNLLLQSQTFDSASWSKIGATVTANTTTAPDGTTTADTLVEDTSTGVHIAFQAGSFVAGTTYTITVFAKAGTRTRLNMINVGGVSYEGNFDLLTGTVISSPLGTASITAAGNGWYRCQMTSTAGATASGNVQFRLVSSGTTTSYTGDGTSGLFLWGAQLEAGASATSYIPTVASQVTRSADDATMTGTNFTSWFNASQGSFVADWSVLALNSAVRRYVWSGTDTGTQRLSFRALDIGANNPTAAIGTGAAVVSLNGNTYTANTNVRAAVAYGSSMALSQNGATPVADASAASVSISSLSIGSWNLFGGYLNGHIRSIAYYNTRLPNATLQELTAPSLAITLNLDFINGTYDA